MRDVFEEGEFDACMRREVIEESFQHQEDLRTAGDIWVQGHRIDRLVHFPVHPVELVTPELFDIARVHEAVRVWAGFDVHHGWQVVDIP